MQGEDDDTGRPLGMEEPPAHFESASQRARVSTEDWARRAGWIGCNINISRVPAVGRVSVLRDRRWIARADVRRQWDSARFLEGVSLEARGWLVEVLNAVEAIGHSSFTLAEVYAAEARL